MISPGPLAHALRLVHRLGAVWVAVILLYLISGLISPGMFQLSQVLNILQIAAFLGIVAIGQTLALLVGGIDLSVAGVVTMSNIVVTSLMVGRSETLVPALVICLLLAAAVGFINGSLITLARVTPLVATLGTNSILFGAALGLYRRCPSWIDLAGVRRVRAGAPLWVTGQHSLLAGDWVGDGLDHPPDHFRSPAVCRRSQSGRRAPDGGSRQSPADLDLYAEQRDGRFGGPLAHFLYWFA